MRHRVAGRGLGRSSSHRKALIRNQITELLRHERIVTTEAKAKSVRPAAEKVITLGKQGSLHARRQAGAILTDKKVLKRLFDDIAPRFEQRRGGYTRIVKLGPRQGDGAHMALLELVDGPIVAPQETTAAPAPTEKPEAVAETVTDDTSADDAASDDAAEPAADDDASAATDEADDSDSEEETAEDGASAVVEAEASADDSADDEDGTNEDEDENKAEKEED